MKLNRHEMRFEVNLSVLVLAGGRADEGAASLVQVVEHDLAEPVFHVDLLVVDEGRQGPELFRRPLQRKWHPVEIFENNETANEQSNC